MEASNWSYISHFFLSLSINRLIIFACSDLKPWINQINEQKDHKNWFFNYLILMIVRTISTYDVKKKHDVQGWLCCAIRVVHNFHFCSNQLRKYLIWCPLSCHFQICKLFCCTTSLKGPSNDPLIYIGKY